MQPSELFLAEHGRPKINYGLIAQAIAFYQKLGFEYIEVPWIVPEFIRRLTYNGPISFNTEFGPLVGSAEQSFLFLAQSNLIESNKLYVAATPCFRDDICDTTHQKSFFKVELFYYNFIDCGMAHFILSAAQQFFRTLNLESIVERINMHQSDLMANGIELGSYGTRLIDGKYFAYGTGLAEPRTTHVLTLGQVHNRLRIVGEH